MWPLRRHERPPSEATAARQKAEQDLNNIRAETPRIRALAESLRDLRQNNHFAAAIEQTFRGGRS